MKGQGREASSEAKKTWLREPSPSRKLLRLAHGCKLRLILERLQGGAYSLSCHLHWEGGIAVNEVRCDAFRIADDLGL